MLMPRLKQLLSYCASPCSHGQVNGPHWPEHEVKALHEWLTQHQRRVLTPFGSPASNIDEGSFDVPDAKRPLRVLFAGSMGQRKGLADLFAAMRLLADRPIELVVLGSLQESPEFYRRQYEGFRHEAGRPHAQVLELMRSCDVFCLPSIVEGRALVVAVGPGRRRDDDHPGPGGHEPGHRVADDG